MFPRTQLIDEHGAALMLAVNERKIRRLVRLVRTVADLPVLELPCIGFRFDQQELMDWARKHRREVQA